jgi:hypothetical protein
LWFLSKKPQEEPHERVRSALGVRSGPFSIEGAPPIDDLVLLLFCPEQGGWHTGVRFEGRWLAHISTEIVLRPTHWFPAPADPPGFDQ